MGQWLCRALLREGWQVAGTTIGTLPEPGTLTGSEISAIHWRAIDLRLGAEERRSIRALLEAQPPDAIFHLAAISYQPDAGHDRATALGVNAGALVLLLDGLQEPRAAGVIDPVLLTVGSGEQYGRHDQAAQPLGEDTPCAPLSFYGATKVAQEQLALSAHRADGVRVMATRSFNHSGRGQAPQFLLPALVKRAKEAKASGTPVAIGNTDTVRDFLHVEDVVDAYISLITRGTPGEVYNVCSGSGVRVGDLAAEVLAAAGVSAGLRPDPGLQRRVDVPTLVGDNAKLRAATGWSPRRTRADIISELLNAAS